jgi:glycine/D-amino acid oxidase-like deaminating enzyme
VGTGFRKTSCSSNNLERGGDSKKSHHAPGFWLQDHPRPLALQADAAPTRTDVAVIGGGLTGLNAARVLARAGFTVAVFEAGRIGHGASGRNGGFCTVGPAVGFGLMAKRYSGEVARQFWAMSRASVDLVAETLEQEGIDAEFARCGRIRLAAKPKHAERLAREADFLSSELKYPTRFVPAHALDSLIGYGRFHGGLLDEGSACLHPAKLLFGLARAAQQNGAKLVEDTLALAVRRDGAGGFLVTHPGGVTRAGNVIIATEGYTGGLVPALQRRIFPVGSYVIVTEPLSEEEKTRFNPTTRIFSTTLNFMNYFRLTRDGRILFGGRNDLAVDQAPAQSRLQLKNRFNQLFPELRHRSVASSWGGRLGFTVDRMPHVGVIDGVHYALGYCGHGVPTAVWCGRAVAEMIMGRPPAVPFTQIGHPAVPFYRGNPWFLPLVGWWYRFKDRVLN